MRNCCLIFLLTVFAGGIANAQTVDLYEFGRIAAFSVRTATWLDYFNQKCKVESVKAYSNLSDSILRQIDGRSSRSVLENASKVSGLTPEKITKFATDEVDEKLSELGGCKSKKMKAWIDDVKMNNIAFNKYLLDVADLMRRSPGRNIFR